MARFDGTTNIFISYSRREKDWVQDFINRLQWNGYYAWYDGRIPVGRDWWLSICNNIRAQDFFIFLVTSASSKSVYCRGEMEFAIALNKPIIPIILIGFGNSSHYPEELSGRRIQYIEFNIENNIWELLFKIEQSICQQKIGIISDELVNNDVPNPSVPEPINVEQLYETYELAEIMYKNGDIMTAKQLLSHVEKAQPTGLGVAAKTRHEAIDFEIERASAYDSLLRMFNSGSIPAVTLAWDEFRKKYRGYDPQSLGNKLGDFGESLIDERLAQQSSSGFSFHDE